MRRGALWEEGSAGTGGMGEGTRVPVSALYRRGPKEMPMGRYLLLWLLGVPIPILLLIWAFGGLN
jgi:hypothetical protein